LGVFWRLVSLGGRGCTWSQAGRPCTEETAVRRVACRGHVDWLCELVFALRCDGPIGWRFGAKERHYLWWRNCWQLNRAWAVCLCIDALIDLRDRDL